MATHAAEKPNTSIHEARQACFLSPEFCSRSFGSKRNEAQRLVGACQDEAHQLRECKGLKSEGQNLHLNYSALSFLSNKTFLTLSPYAGQSA